MPVKNSHHKFGCSFGIGRIFHPRGNIPTNIRLSILTPATITMAKIFRTKLCVPIFSIFVDATHRYLHINEYEKNQNSTDFLVNSETQKQPTSF